MREPPTECGRVGNYEILTTYTIEKLLVSFKHGSPIQQMKRAMQCNGFFLAHIGKINGFNQILIFFSKKSFSAKAFLKILAFVRSE